MPEPIEPGRLLGEPGIVLGDRFCALAFADCSDFDDFAPDSIPQIFSQNDAKAG